MNKSKKKNHDFAKKAKKLIIYLTKANYTNTYFQITFSPAIFHSLCWQSGLCLSFLYARSFHCADGGGQALPTVGCSCDAKAGCA